MHRAEKYETTSIHSSWILVVYLGKLSHDCQTRSSMQSNHLILMGYVISNLVPYFYPLQTLVLHSHVLDLCQSLQHLKVTGELPYPKQSLLKSGTDLWWRRTHLLLDTMLQKHDFDWCNFFFPNLENCVNKWRTWNPNTWNNECGEPAASYKGTGLSWGETTKWSSKLWENYPSFCLRGAYKNSPQFDKEKPKRVNM